MLDVPVPTSIKAVVLDGDAELLTVGGATVTIVALRARLVDERPLVLSDEHTAVRFFALDALPEPLPDVYRDAIAAAHTAR